MANKSEQIKRIIFTAILMVIGLIMFKFIPMNIFGVDILFDASMHLTIAIFILYSIYLFIDENKDWRVPYFIFALSVLTIISLQRIIDNAHNDVGLLTGLIISIVSIIIPNYKYFKKRIKF